ncbi:MAG: hypothetical protein AAB446_00700 [Patescibacteria group bacterium]
MIALIDSAFALINNILIPMAFAFCLFYFFWGVAKYIRTGAGSEKTAEEGKKTMIWGLVGIFVAFSVWGIIIFIRNELGIPGIDSIERPTNENVTTSVHFGNQSNP